MEMLRKFFPIALLVTAISFTSCDDDDGGDNNGGGGGNGTLAEQAEASGNIVTSDSSSTGATSLEDLFNEDFSEGNSWAVGTSYQGLFAEGELTAEEIEEAKDGGNVKSGAITADETWSGVVILDGAVFVDENVTLTIEAGTKVVAISDGTIDYLLVRQGGVINAIGTAEEVIVFTAVDDENNDGTYEAPTRGDFGGLLLNGRASINNGDSNGEAAAEVDVDEAYGGSDDADNSGTLQYIRIEYSGNQIDPETEHNGLTLNGVGNGTKIDHIQIFQGRDDGIEFFGGTVEMSDIVVIGSGDDQVDWTFGWRGTITNLLAIVAEDGGHRGIEGDNQNENNAATPFSEPSITNVTLIDLNEGADNDENEAVLLRVGTKGVIENLRTEGFKTGIRIVNDQTLLNVIDDDLNVESSINDDADNMTIFEGDS
ncbi:hypothetical protein V6R21_24005 [Limibacter armeniacum]|uniref:hypothetical protein n=1 Tax=Limibacter armeniacum TaxID=466084 RepID=UPI002FE6304D